MIHYCENCGKQLGQDDAYCTNCGKKVTNYHYQTIPYFSNASGKKRKRSKLAITGLVLSVLQFLLPIPVIVTASALSFSVAGVISVAKNRSKGAICAAFGTALSVYGVWWTIRMAIRVFEFMSTL